jgi:hypothetical protein
MLKHFLYFLLIVLLSCDKPSDKSVKEQEYYDFINDAIKVEGSRILVESPDTFTMNMEGLERRIFSIPRLHFSKEDKEFIIQQYNKSKSFKWAADSLKNTSVVTYETIRKYKKQGWPKIKYDSFGHGFYQYALPLFTIDHTLCIFSFGYHCGGECGEGRTIIFQWDGKHWVKLHDMRGWIS